MEYIVRMPKKLEKTLREMPENAKRTLFHIEYVGSREKAPY
jgi:hypothetical protein